MLLDVVRYFPDKAWGHSGKPSKLKHGKTRGNKLGLSCAKLRANLTWLGFIWCKFPSFDLFIDKFDLKSYSKF